MEATYTGICLLASKKIVVLVNYENKKKTFDGFTIFKNQDFNSFETWKKKWVNITKDNSIDFIGKYKINRLRTFYSWFKELVDKGLVAFFTNNTCSSYFVGQIKAVDINKIKVKLIDKEGIWIKEKSFKISAIDFLVLTPTMKANY